MSDKNGSSSKLDLLLNSPKPRVVDRSLESPTRSTTVSPTSPPSSSVSSNLNQEEDDNNNVEHSNNPETISMVLVGCPRCLMYVMISEDNFRCPKCKNSDLIEIYDDNKNNLITGKKG